MEKKKGWLIIDSAASEVRRDKAHKGRKKKLLPLLALGVTAASLTDCLLQRQIVRSVVERTEAPPSSKGKTAPALPPSKSLVRAEEISLPPAKTDSRIMPSMTEEEREKKRELRRDEILRDWQAQLIIASNGWHYLEPLKEFPDEVRNVSIEDWQLTDQRKWQEANKFLLENFGFSLAASPESLLRRLIANYRNSVVKLYPRAPAGSDDWGDYNLMMIALSQANLPLSSLFDPTKQEADALCEQYGELIGGVKGREFIALLTKLAWWRENGLRSRNISLHGDNFWPVAPEGALNAWVRYFPDENCWGYPLALKGGEEITAVQFHTEKEQVVLPVPADFVVINTLANLDFGSAILIDHLIAIAAGIQEGNGYGEIYDSLRQIRDRDPSQLSQFFEQDLRHKITDKEIILAMTYALYYYGRAPFEQNWLSSKKFNPQEAQDIKALLESEWGYGFKLALWSLANPPWLQERYRGRGYTFETENLTFYYNVPKEKREAKIASQALEPYLNVLSEKKPENMEEVKEIFAALPDAEAKQFLLELMKFFLPYNPEAASEAITKIFILLHSGKFKPDEAKQASNDLGQLFVEVEALFNELGFDPASAQTITLRGELFSGLLDYFSRDDVSVKEMGGRVAEFRLLSPKAKEIFPDYLKAKKQFKRNADMKDWIEVFFSWAKIDSQLAPGYFPSAKTLESFSRFLARFTSSDRRRLKPEILAAFDLQKYLGAYSFTPFTALDSLMERTNPSPETLKLELKTMVLIGQLFVQKDLVGPPPWAFTENPRANTVEFWQRLNAISRRGDSSAFYELIFIGNEIFVKEALNKEESQAVKRVKIDLKNSFLPEMIREELFDFLMDQIYEDRVYWNKHTGLESLSALARLDDPSQRERVAASMVNRGQAFLYSDEQLKKIANLLLVPQPDPEKIWQEIKDFSDKNHIEIQKSIARIREAKANEDGLSAEQKRILNYLIIDMGYSIFRFNKYWILSSDKEPDFLMEIALWAMDTPGYKDYFDPQEEIIGFKRIKTALAEQRYLTDPAKAAGFKKLILRELGDFKREDFYNIVKFNEVYINLWWGDL